MIALGLGILSGWLLGGQDSDPDADWWDGPIDDAMRILSMGWLAILATILVGLGVIWALIRLDFARSLFMPIWQAVTGFYRDVLRWFADLGGGILRVVGL